MLAALKKWIFGDEEKESCWIMCPCCGMRTCDLTPAMLPYAKLQESKPCFSEYTCGNCGSISEWFTGAPVYVLDAVRDQSMSLHEVQVHATNFLMNTRMHYSHRVPEMALSCIEKEIQYLNEVGKDIHVSLLSIIAQKMFIMALACNSNNRLDIGKFLDSEHPTLRSVANCWKKDHNVSSVFCVDVDRVLRTARKFVAAFRCDEPVEEKEFALVELLMACLYPIDAHNGLKDLGPLLKARM